MKAVWPDEAGFAGVFSEGDPCPGELIQDQYRLVTYSADLAIATSPQLPGLDLTGLVDIDIDGNPRTPPYSMGAYEHDGACQ